MNVNSTNVEIFTNAHVSPRTAAELHFSGRLIIAKFYTSGKIKLLATNSSTIKSNLP